MKLLLILTFVVYSARAQIQYVSSDLEPLSDEMTNALNALDLTWKAGKNFNGNSSIQINDLVSNVQEFYDDFDKLEYVPTVGGKYYLPKRFDAREIWPECPSIGKIYTQKKGYPSWLYAAVGSIADRICILNGTQIDVEATIERLIKSNVHLEGIGQIFNYWANNGLAVVKLSQNTSNALEANQVQLDFYNLTVKSAVECRHKKLDIWFKGPLAVYLKVYSDFPSYKSGVYQRRSQKLLGMHYVKIIGWGIENDRTYLLAANSWGSEWGDNGLFKIDYCTGQFGKTPKDPSASLTYIKAEIELESLNEQQIFLKN